MGHFFSFTRDFTITDFSHFLICLACRCLSTSKFCLSLPSIGPYVMMLMWEVKFHWSLWHYLLPLPLCLCPPLSSLTLSTGIGLMGFYRKRVLMELWPLLYHIYKALHTCSLAQNCNSALSLRAKRRKSNPVIHCFFKLVRQLFCAHWTSDILFCPIHVWPVGVPVHSYPTL